MKRRVLVLLAEGQTSKQIRPAGDQRADGQVARFWPDAAVRCTHASRADQPCNGKRRLARRRFTYNDYQRKLV